MDRIYKAVIEKNNNSPPFLQAAFHLFYERKRVRIEDGYEEPFLNRCALCR